MHRPRPKITYFLTKIINEEISHFIINEILKPQNTKYEIIKNNVSNNDYESETYRFKTNKNFSYDVEFYETICAFKFIKLTDGTTLPDKYNDIVTKGIIIGFTPTEINQKEIPNELVGTMDDPYLNRTNRSEQYEVLSKVIFLIKEFIKNNDFYLYINLKNTYDTNLNVYNSIYLNVFKNDFEVFEAEDAFYYIKNN